MGWKPKWSASTADPSFHVPIKPPTGQAHCSVLSFHWSVETSRSLHHLFICPPHRQLHGLPVPTRTGRLSAEPAAKPPSSSAPCLQCVPVALCLIPAVENVRRRRSWAPRSSSEEDGSHAADALRHVERLRQRCAAQLSLLASRHSAWWLLPTVTPCTGVPAALISRKDFFWNKWETFSTATTARSSGGGGGGKGVVGAGGQALLQ